MYRNKAFVSLPSPTDFPINIESSEWLFLQGNKGAKLGGHVLSSETRTDLVKVTSIYASSFRNIEHTASFDVMAEKILNWIKATHELRQEIWKEKGENGSEWLALTNLVGSRQMNFESIQETILSSGRTDLERQFPLALLSRILNGSILTALTVATDLQHEWASHQRNLWFIWAATVFSILGNAGVRVKDPNRKKLLNGPLKVLERLQQKLPNELKLRGVENTASEAATSESFRKGAVIAYKLRKGNPTSNLENILTRWGQGEFDTSYRKGSPEIDILLRLHRLAWPSKWAAAKRMGQV